MPFYGPQHYGYIYIQDEVLRSTHCRLRLLDLLRVTNEKSIILWIICIMTNTCKHLLYSTASHHICTHQAIIIYLFPLTLSLQKQNQLESLADPLSMVSYVIIQLQTCKMINGLELCYGQSSFMVPLFMISLCKSLNLKICLYRTLQHTMMLYWSI